MISYANDPPWLREQPSMHAPTIGLRRERDVTVTDHVLSLIGKSPMTYFRCSPFLKIVRILGHLKGPFNDIGELPSDLSIIIKLRLPSNPGPRSRSTL